MPVKIYSRQLRTLTHRARLSPRQLIDNLVKDKLLSKRRGIEFFSKDTNCRMDKLNGIVEKLYEFLRGTRHKMAREAIHQFLTSPPISGPFTSSSPPSLSKVLLYEVSARRLESLTSTIDWQEDDHRVILDDNSAYAIICKDHRIIYEFAEEDAVEFYVKLDEAFGEPALLQTCVQRWNQIFIDWGGPNDSDWQEPARPAAVMTIYHNAKTDILEEKFGFSYLTLWLDQRAFSYRDIESDLLFLRQLALTI